MSDASEIRKLATVIVRGFKRGGALSARELGNLLVGESHHSWVAGYEAAIEDFYSSDTFEELSGLNWRVKNAAIARSKKAQARQLPATVSGKK